MYVEIKDSLKGVFKGPWLTPLCALWNEGLSEGIFKGFWLTPLRALGDEGLIEGGFKGFWLTPLTALWDEGLSEGVFKGFWLTPLRALWDEGLPEGDAIEIFHHGLLLVPDIQVHIPATRLTPTTRFLPSSWVEVQAICLTDKSEIRHHVCCRTLYWAASYSRTHFFKVCFNVILLSIYAVF
jgi:hypothetical protein